MKRSHSIPGILAPVAVGTTGLLSMTLIAYSLESGALPLWIMSPYRIVNLTFTMQAMVLPISFVALAAMYLYDAKSFATFFRWRLRSDGSNGGWPAQGVIIAAAFTAGNALLMSAGVVAQHGAINSTFYSLLPWVLAFAASNAWSEEIFSRFAIVAGLHGKIKPITICWISAIIFGLPHFFGTPSGLLGVAGAGLLGWLLAQSVIETKALAWAWLIHFLQDVVIFGAGAMIIAGNSKP